MDDQHSEKDRTSVSTLTIPQQNTQQTSELFPNDKLKADAKSQALSRARYFRHKNLAERIIGGILFVLTAPVMIVVAVLVKLTSHGPAIYRQERLGKHGEGFEVLKFRSMYSDAEKDGKPVWSSKRDSRITPLGRFLRASHLDELPQLWNVLMGDMVLTGPRPERPKICDVLAGQIDGYYRRNAVKPGITGLAQINLPPDETLADVKRKQFLDLHYIEHAGWLLDFRMIMATVLRIFFIKGEKAMGMMGLCRRSLVRASVVTTEDDNRHPFDDPRVKRVDGESTGDQVVHVCDQQHATSELASHLENAGRPPASPR